MISRYSSQWRADNASFDWDTKGMYLGFEYLTGKGKDEGRVAVIVQGGQKIFQSMKEADKFMEQEALKRTRGTR